MFIGIYVAGAICRPQSYTMLPGTQFVMVCGTNSNSWIHQFPWFAEHGWAQRVSYYVMHIYLIQYINTVSFLKLHTLKYDLVGVVFMQTLLLFGCFLSNQISPCLAIGFQTMTWAQISYVLWALLKLKYCGAHDPFFIVDDMSNKDIRRMKKSNLEVLHIARSLEKQSYLSLDSSSSCCFSSRSVDMFHLFDNFFQI